MEWITHLKNIVGLKTEKNIYGFHDDSTVDVIGCKGTGLCDLMKLGLPVPRGFIIASSIAKKFYEEWEGQRVGADFFVVPHKGSSGSTSSTAVLTSVASRALQLFHGSHSNSSTQATSEPPTASRITTLIDDVRIAVHGLETEANQAFGAAKSDSGSRSIFGALLSVPSHKAAKFPLLLAVRPSPPFPMGGKTDAVLNIGMNSTALKELCKISGSRWFGLDAYRRFLQSFGTVVLGIDKARFLDAFENVLVRSSCEFQNITEDDLDGLVSDFLTIIGPLAIPEDPWEQLAMAIWAVCNSWNSAAAVAYRQIHGHTMSSAPAIIVQSMVFGNMNANSGSGICFSRNPCNGANEIFTEYFPRCQGLDADDGLHNPMKLTLAPSTCQESLESILRLLEGKYRCLLSVEFTIENGVLYILEAKAGSGSPIATVRIAMSMVSEHLIQEREALLQLDAKNMKALNWNFVDEHIDNSGALIGKGVPTSPWTVCGRLVFNKADALQYAATNQQIIVCRKFAVTTDIDSFYVECDGIMTVYGGGTSKAAGLLRVMGKVAIIGIGHMYNNNQSRWVSIDCDNSSVLLGDGTILQTGDIVTLDGATGHVYRGKLQLCHLVDDPDFLEVLGWCNRHKRMKIMAQAFSPDDASMALQKGTDGIGLLSTEYMFRSSNELSELKTLLKAETKEDKAQPLMNLRGFHMEHMVTVFRFMRNRPVIVRLMYPLHLIGEIMDVSRPRAVRPAERSSSIRRTGIGSRSTTPAPSALQASLETSAFLSGLMEPRTPLCYSSSPSNVSAAKFSADAEALMSLTEDFEESHIMLEQLGMPDNYLEIVKIQTEATIGAACMAFREGLHVRPRIVIPFVKPESDIHEVISVIQTAAEQVFKEVGFSVDYRVGCQIEAPLSYVCAPKAAAELGISFLCFDINHIAGMKYDEDRSHLHRVAGLQASLHSGQFGVGSMIATGIKEALQVRKGLVFGICGELCRDPESINFFEQLGVDYVVTLAEDVAGAKLSAAQAYIRSKSSS